MDTAERLSGTSVGVGGLEPRPVEIWKSVRSTLSYLLVLNHRHASNFFSIRQFMKAIPLLASRSETKTEALGSCLLGRPCCTLYGTSTSLHRVWLFDASIRANRTPPGLHQVGTSMQSTGRKGYGRCSRVLLQCRNFWRCCRRLHVFFFSQEAWSRRQRRLPDFRRPISPRAEDRLHFPVQARSASCWNTA